MIRHVLTFMLQSLVFVMLLSIGLQTSIADIKAAAQRRELIMRTALVANFAVPLLAIVLVALLPLTPGARGLVLLAAICPGAPFVLTKFKQKVQLPSVLLAAVSVLAVISVPVWAALIGRLFSPLQFQVSAGQVLLITLRGLLLPLGLGLAIRHFLPGVAGPLAKLAVIFYKVALIVALIIVLVIGGPAILDARPMAILAVILLTMGAALLGHWAGGPDPEERDVAATVAALGSPALLAAIAASSYPSVRVGAVLAAYLIVRGLALLPYKLWMKQHLGKPESPQASPPPPRVVHAPS